MCRTWGWNPRPAAYQTDAHLTELPRPAKKFKIRRVVHTDERLALPRSMSSVRYSLEAIYKSLTQTASRCTESCIIIQQSSWSDWNIIWRSFKPLNNLMSQCCPPWAKNKKLCKICIFGPAKILPRLKSTIANINHYIWSKHMDFHL